MVVRVLVAPDSYKGSATAGEVAAAMREGLAVAWPDAEIELMPMSDGGDGFVEAMVLACGGTFETVRVRGPLGTVVPARYGLLPDGTAAIEMAEASGLRLLRSDERDPLRASTYGTGELIKTAIERGARNLIVGIGGSATNDGGAGMAEALGVEFLDSAGKRLASNPLSLANLHSVDVSGLHTLLASGKVTITAACDVKAVLCGDGGASRIFGPQKGANPQQVEFLDGVLAKYADVVDASIGNSVGKGVRDLPGAGAAGGLGFGLMAFLRAALKPGFDVVSEAANLPAKVAKASIVFTGEGRTDYQSQLGKTVHGVVRLASERDVPVVIISGSIESSQDAKFGECAECGGNVEIADSTELIGGNEPRRASVLGHRSSDVSNGKPFAGAGLVALTSITDGPVTLAECMANAIPMIKAAAFRTAKMLDVGATLPRIIRQATPHKTTQKYTY